MGDNFRYSEYSNSRAVGEQYPAEHQYPPGQPVSGQAWSSVEPCQPVAGQAWGGVESGNGGRRGRGRGRGRGGFRGGRGRGNGAQGGNWSNGAQGGNWSNGAQGGNWSNGASDVTSRLQALAEPSAPAVDAQGRKRRFREIMDSDWTSNYDGHLPQEILSQCTVFSCGLCGIKFSSDVVQKDHYQGQHHDKKVQAALADIAAKTGTSVLKKKKVGLDVKVDSFLNTERLANWQKDYLDTWDTALPDELLQLVRPSRCELCLLDLSSNIVATSHLNGKNHDKKVKVWLDEYCKRNGKDVPKKKVLECSLQEKMCEYCNVELTSVTMAKSHYSGRQHLQRVQSGVKKPADNNDNRFGIGNSFVQQEKQFSEVLAVFNPNPINPGNEMKTSIYFCPPCAVDLKTEVNYNAHVAGKKHKNMVGGGMSAGSKFHCEVCNVSVTSQQGLEDHQKGQKHLKKVQGSQGGSGKVQTELSCEVCNIFVSSAPLLEVHMAGKQHKKKSEKSVEKDMQEFRCETCQVSCPNNNALEMHIKGKKHLAKMKTAGNPSQAVQVENNAETVVTNTSSADATNTSSADATNTSSADATNTSSANATNTY